MSEVVRLEDIVEFAENAEPRCSTVLLLDVAAAHLDELNLAVRAFRALLTEDPVGLKRSEGAILAYAADCVVVQDFLHAGEFEPRELTAEDIAAIRLEPYKSLQRALRYTLGVIEGRKRQLREMRICRDLPWVHVVTDGAAGGEPGESLAAATLRIREEEARKNVFFYPVSTEGADTNRLYEIFGRPPMALAEWAADL
jgi:uncharacterized protein YegL